MKNPVVWKDLKFYPTPRVGRGREKHIFVHQSYSNLFNIASKTTLSLSEWFQTIIYLNFNTKNVPPGWGGAKVPKSYKVWHVVYQNHGWGACNTLLAFKLILFYLFLFYFYFKLYLTIAHTASWSRCSRECSALHYLQWFFFWFFVLQNTYTI